MRRISVNIYPKDGYFFVETDGTIIRSNKNWTNLAQLVGAYRKRNKLPLGNPTLEVNTQACARDPVSCHEDMDETTMKHLKIATLKGRVLAWLASVRARQPLSFTDEGTMRARASVCSRCPAHASIGGGCGSCKRAITAVRQELLGGRPVDDRVSGCTVLEEDCAVNSWLADPTSDRQDLPGCCWRRSSPP